MHLKNLIKSTARLMQIEYSVVQIYSGPTEGNVTKPKPNWCK